MRNVGRNIYEIPRSGFITELQMLAPAHTGAASHDVEDGFELAMMMRSGFRSRLHNDRTRPKLRRTRARVSNGRSARHSRSLRRVWVKFASPYDLYTVILPVPYTGIHSHYANLPEIRVSIWYNSVDLECVLPAISPNHPLRTLFTELVQTRLLGTAQLNDIAVARYIAGVLVDFCRVESLYKIRDSKGKMLEDVAEMLIASNPVLEGRSFIYEREVRKHIGDYTLFLAGIFPEYVARIQRQKRRLDSFVDYLKAGKESYGVVAAFDQFEFKHEAPIFRRLSERFELCVFGLNLIKQDLDHLQSNPYNQLGTILG